MDLTTEVHLIEVPANRKKGLRNPGSLCDLEETQNPCLLLRSGTGDGRYGQEGTEPVAEGFGAESGPETGWTS